MKTPPRNRKAEMNNCGEVCMMICNRGSYYSPGNHGIVDGSPISSISRKKAKIHNSPMVVMIINDPNITPPVSR
jgi:hypothetical protein